MFVSAGSMFCCMHYIFSIIEQKKITYFVEFLNHKILLRIKYEYYRIYII